ncbi:ARM repeat-containing protein [Dissoconium aciculare CBS 342.82]|uniref:ARM repeat-containing protein n=1 Tax=Dissoconium aciculare CBS 342.82 TaxID=1314786 RepID=A0A6J3MEA4_9PEZI|nr:ARM repeat-containing protein [Dissoconium aciculare CBS 342.82]KAF1826208.1 ARM repeat-containing protein [Dissoconium aciculare CBS 342.82]
MAAIKRKEAPSKVIATHKKHKSGEDKAVKSTKPLKSTKASKVAKVPVKPPTPEASADDDDHGDGDDFEDFDEEGGVAVEVDGDEDPSVHPSRRGHVSGKQQNGAGKDFKLDSNSAEAHAKQRALAKERKAAKPNADSIQEAKKIWERLRQKLNVPETERKELLDELFGLMQGRIRDFVFKHDSVRVVQTAVKYCDAKQLKIIVQELKDDVRALVESKYGKFLVAKMVVNGDEEDRKLIVPQFYGHVKRLINHPEASWIVDDIYRNAIAAPEQKATMLREWYGTEYSLANRNIANTSGDEITSDLKAILEKNPEKRKPIMGYLHQMINNLIQKKMTGFTMLHDAMLQYFLVLTPGGEEHTEFLETLKGDIDAEEADGGGDLYRNLSFTKSGSRLVSYAIAYGSAKDRKMILKCFKDNIGVMAVDNHAKLVLAVALEVPDDTRNALQIILRELLGLQIEAEEARLQHLEGLLEDANARLPLLLPIAGMPRWLIKDDGDRAFLEEIFQIRETTSKKAAATRDQELCTNLAGPLLDLIAARADSLVRSKTACPAISEILFHCAGPSREAARDAVAQTAADDPTADGHVAKDPATSRLLKALVAGGPFEPAAKKIRLVEPRLGFGAALWPVIQDDVLAWACGEASFVVLAFLESEDVSDKIKTKIRDALRKNRKSVQAAADGARVEDDGAKVVGEETNGEKKRARKPKQGRWKNGNAGAKLLLERLDA